MQAETRQAQKKMQQRRINLLLTQEEVTICHYAYALH